jgi:signal transduction histidine kinase
VTKPERGTQADLISLVAHDLRNPLAAIVANLCYLRSAVEHAGPEVDAALADAEMACVRLERMTTNLTVLAKAVRHREPKRHNASLGDMCHAAAARARPAAERSRVRIDMVGDDVPHVMVDVELFGVALDNLIANAIQYSPAGHAVTLALVASGARASVTIVDDGPVIPAAMRDTALRLEGQITAKSSVGARYGLALAMYAANEAARLAGAALAVKEKDGKNAFELAADVVHC